MNTSDHNTIVFDNVSKFYGEILGVIETLEIRAEYQPGRPQRRREDDADEPGVRVVAADARHGQRPRHSD
jgi:hypothetical protein